MIVLVLASCAPAHAAVVGWGPNRRGELGADYTSGPQGPVTAQQLGAVRQIVSTYHSSYALLADGTVRAWGGNVWGQLGDGSHQESPAPMRVTGLSGVTAIAAGGAHAMALLSNGTVETWGSNMFGELGNRTTGAGHETGGSDVPIPVPGLSGVVAIAAGGADDAALLADGTVLAWGENKLGQIGDGTRVEKDVPTPVRGVSGARAIAVGGMPTLGGHMLALLNDGTVLAWGANGSGQLGNGTMLSGAAATPVTGLRGVVAVSASVSHSLALTSNGTVESWGSDLYGELGTTVSERCSGNPCSRVPVPVLTGASAISAGYAFSEAIREGSIEGFGLNDYGQLGDGTTINKAHPVTAQGVDEATAISAGEYHTLALTSSAGPTPACESIAGAGSLALRWRSANSSSTWTVAWRPVSKPRGPWWRAVQLPSSARGFTVTGLAAGPYEVLVKSRGFGEAVILAAPLP